MAGVDPSICDQLGSGSFFGGEQGGPRKFVPNE